MIRAGTDADIPSAAAMLQRAWPDTISTEAGMRHGLDAVPPRAELVRLVVEEAGEIVGWATAGRAWWIADPGHGNLQLAVDPAARGRGIGAALAERADRHLEEIGVHTTRAGSLDLPAARALARARGFTELGSSSVSAIDPRTVEPLPVPAGVTVVPFSELDAPEPIYELDVEVSQDIPNEEYDAITLAEWVRRYWRSPVIDGDASLAAFVNGELAAVTMIRVDRPSGTGTEQPHRRAPGVPRSRARPTSEVAQPEPGCRAGRDDRDHGQRRDERADARGERTARVPPVRPAARVGAGTGGAVANRVRAARRPGRRG